MSSPTETVVVVPNAVSPNDPPLLPVAPVVGAGAAPAINPVPGGVPPVLAQPPIVVAAPVNGVLNPTLPQFGLNQVPGAVTGTANDIRVFKRANKYKSKCYSRAVAKYARRHGRTQNQVASRRQAGVVACQRAYKTSFRSTKQVTEHQQMSEFGVECSIDHYVRVDGTGNPSGAVDKRTRVSRWNFETNGHGKYWMACFALHKMQGKTDGIASNRANDELAEYLCMMQGTTAAEVGFQYPL